MQEWKRLSSSSTTQPLSLSTQAENKPIIELGLKVDTELQAYFQSDRLPASEFEAHAEKHFSEIAIDIDQGKTHALSVGTAKSPEPEKAAAEPEPEGEQLESVI